MSFTITSSQLSTAPTTPVSAINSLSGRNNTPTEEDTSTCTSNLQENQILEMLDSLTARVSTQTSNQSEELKTGLNIVRKRIRSPSLTLNTKNHQQSPESPSTPCERPAKRARRSKPQSTLLLEWIRGCSDQLLPCNHITTCAWYDRMCICPNTIYAHSALRTPTKEECKLLQPLFPLTIVATGLVCDRCGLWVHQGWGKRA